MPNRFCMILFFMLGYPCDHVLLISVILSDDVHKIVQIQKARIKDSEKIDHPIRPSIFFFRIDRPLFKSQ
jgi:hypothetical protein